MKTKSGRYRKPTAKEKIEMYESIFHEIYLCRCYSLNTDRIQEILSNVEKWSRAQGMDGPYFGEEKSHYDYVYGTFWNLTRRETKNS
jgi:hypothetical protein